MLLLKLLVCLLGAALLTYLTAHLLAWHQRQQHALIRALTTRLLDATRERNEAQECLNAERLESAHLRRQVTSWREHWEITRPHYDALKRREADQLIARIRADLTPRSGYTLPALLKLEGLTLPPEEDK